MHFPFNFPSLTRLSLSGLSHHTRSLSSLSRVFISPPSTEQSHQQTHIFSPVLPFLHQQQQQPLVRNYTIAIPRGKKLKRIRSILAPRKTTADGENTSLLPFGKNRDAFGKKITFHERQKQLKKARELPPSQFVQALQEKYPMHVMPEKRLASQGRKRSRNTMSRVDRILIESKMRKIRDTDPDEYNKLLESRNYLNASFLSEEEKLEEMAKMNRKSWRKLNPLSESFFEPPPPKSRVFTGRNFDALDELKREQSYITGTLNPARQIGFRDAKPQKIKYVGKWLELGSRKIEQRQPTPLESLLNTPSLSSSSLALLSSSSSSSSSPLSLTSSSSYDLQQSTNANLPSHVDSETINGNFLPSLTTPTPEIGWESLMTLYKQERRKNKPRQGIRKFSKTLIKTAKLERWLRAVRVEQANAVRNKMAKGKERLRKKRESLKQLKLEAQTIAAAQRLQEENLKSQALTLGLYSRHDEILKEEEKKVYQDILLQSLYSIKPSPSSSSPSPSLSSLSSSSKTTTSTSTSTSALSPTSKKSQEEWEKFNELSGSKLKALFRQREGFVDRAHVTIRAGNGGQGRPAGVGGHGGNILAVVKSSASLASIQKSIVGNHGTNSDHKQPRGKSGKDTIINVPLGSIITNSKTKQLIADMSTVGKIALLAKGGRGGGYEGSLKGLKGEALSVNIELKSIADVGLVGFPNAGKSSLLRAVSNATPNVASYPFTTVKPHIGTVKISSTFDVLVADVPGLVEGAHNNIGMGHNFLRHIERTSALVYVIDVQGFQLSAKVPFRTPGETFKMLFNEISLYKGGGIERRPFIVVVNKLDSDAELEGMEIFNEEFNQVCDELIKEGRMTLSQIKGVLPISALTGFNIPQLIENLGQMVQEVKKTVDSYEWSDVEEQNEEIQTESSN